VDEDDLFRTQSWVGGCEILEGASELGMLPVIVDAVREELETFFDSGIRCEADVSKAPALVQCVV
jgi:lactate 2-monooxygenase